MQRRAAFLPKRALRQASWKNPVPQISPTSPRVLFPSLVGWRTARYCFHDLMASAAQLKALLQSHADGDDSRFFAVGLQVAAAEARKGHPELAKELRDIVEQSRKQETQHAARENLLHIAQPQGEVADLLSVRQSGTRLSDLILDEAAGAHVRRVLHEQRHLDKLKSHGMSAVANMT